MHGSTQGNECAKSEKRNHLGLRWRWRGLDTHYLLSQSWAPRFLKEIASAPLQETRNCFSAGEGFVGFQEIPGFPGQQRRFGGKPTKVRGDRGVGELSGIGKFHAFEGAR